MIICAIIAVVGKQNVVCNYSSVIEFGNDILFKFAAVIKYVNYRSWVFTKSLRRIAEVKTIVIFIIYRSK